MPIYIVLGNWTQKRMDTIKNLPESIKESRKVFEESTAYVLQDFDQGPTGLLEYTHCCGAVLIRPFDAGCDGSPFGDNPERHPDCIHAGGVITSSKVTAFITPRRQLL